jgi:LPPG:FO 2-phospho-L-lactate transferase
MILEIPRIRVALSSAKAPIIGTSPIIGGNPVLGMADKCLMALGLTTSAFSVAKLYGARHDGGLLDGWLISDSDEDQIAKISGLGIATKAAPLLMTDDEKTLRMAISALELAGISVSP